MIVRTVVRDSVANTLTWGLSFVVYSLYPRQQLRVSILRGACLITFNPFQNYLVKPFPRSSIQQNPNFNHNGMLTLYVISYTYGRKTTYRDVCVTFLQESKFETKLTRWYRRATLNNDNGIKKGARRGNNLSRNMCRGGLYLLQPTENYKYKLNEPCNKKITLDKQNSEPLGLHPVPVQLPPTLLPHTQTSTTICPRTRTQFVGYLPWRHALIIITRGDGFYRLRRFITVGDSLSLIVEQPTTTTTHTNKEKNTSRLKLYEICSPPPPHYPFNLFERVKRRVILWMQQKRNNQCRLISQGKSAGTPNAIPRYSVSSFSYQWPRTTLKQSEINFYDKLKNKFAGAGALSFRHSS